MHRFKGELEPKASVQAYEAELRAFFRMETGPHLTWSSLASGKMATLHSLLPETKALAEQQAWAVSNWVEKLKTMRLTLTMPVLNHGKQVIFLVSGGAKAPVISQIPQGAKDASSADFTAQR